MSIHSAEELGQLEPQGAHELLVEGTLPERAHDDDAAADLRYDIDAETVTLEPGERRLLPTGTRIALPRGTAGFVLPRSGLAAKHGITVVNAPGLIDPSYRGDVGVVLLNTGSESFEVNPGDRIAQLMVIATYPVTIVSTDILPDSDTDRGAKGFGSSGVK